MLSCVGYDHPWLCYDFANFCLLWISRIVLVYVFVPCLVSLILCFVSSLLCFVLVQQVLVFLWFSFFFHSFVLFPFAVLMTLFWSSILLFFLLSFVLFQVSFYLGWCLVSPWFGFVFILGDYVCFGLDWFCFLPIGFCFCFCLFSYFTF